MSVSASRSAAETAVLLMAHGSRRAEANQDLFDLSARLSAAGPHRIVQASFLEIAAPDIVSGGSLCVQQGARRVLMVPFLLAAGVHVSRDLAAAREALTAKHPDVAFVLGPPLGPHPMLDLLVADRIRETDEIGQNGVEVDEDWSSR